MLYHGYSQLIAIKRWADRGLHDVIEDNIGQLSGDDTSILLRILDHIHVVDRIFQHHLQGMPHTFQAPRSAHLPDFRALRDGTKEVDDWYTAYAQSLSEKDLEEPLDFLYTSGKAARMRRSEILLHVCLHGTYHRGNAGAVLQLRGIKPNPDAFTDFIEDAGFRSAVAKASA